MAGFAFAATLIVAVSYGLARYTYGLFVPTFRAAFELDDAGIAFIASASYAAYLVASALVIWQAHRVPARGAVIAGGILAAAGLCGVALARNSAELLAAVSVAGLSPCLCYMPLSAIIARSIEERRRPVIYGIINSGTSIGVIVGGPVAILFEDNWRYAWLAFSLFAALVTVACTVWLPLQPGGRSAQDERRSAASRPDLLALAGAPLLLTISLAIGAVCSVYWTFAVDVVALGRKNPSALSADARYFWIIVGVSGLLGAVAGPVVRRFGIRTSMSAFMCAIALATATVAGCTGIVATTASAVLFGAFFIGLSAVIGLWSMQVYREAPLAGFGLAFTAMSVGQFAGPFITGLALSFVSIHTIFLSAAGAMLALAAVCAVSIPHHVDA